MMNDATTDRFRAARQNAQETMRHLIQRTTETIDLLRTQRDMLRQRGMNLPANSLDTLKSMKSGLEKLNNNITSSLVELKQLRELVNTASVINSSLDTQDVLDQVMDTVVRITGAERGYIALINRETGEMEYPVRRGIDQDQMQGDLVVSSTVVKKVVQTGEGILTESAMDDERFQGAHSVINLKLRSILSVPLRVREEIIGAVYCDNRIQTGLFKPHDLNLLKAFGNQAAVAIDNARLFASLETQIKQMTETRDLMTNIFASIASGVITLNRAERVTDCNQAAQTILNISRENLMSCHLLEAFPGLDGDFAEALRVVREGGESELLVLQPELPELGRRHWNVVVSPLRDDEGVVQGATIVIDDLTEIHQLEEKLGKAGNYLKIRLDNLRDVSDLEMGGQEREISVLHCDVRGFTRFSEQLDPQQLMEIINRYMSLSSDAINFYNGVVDKYMGDAVTGMFNTQFNPNEDHALRAVRAAMHMKLDLLALHEELPPTQQLFYGIGIHTGSAVVGNIGGTDRKDFGALGDAPEIAKLLQENAEKGEVLISPATYELVRDYYECEALEPRKTKGHDELTLMYRVLKHKRRQTTEMDTLNLENV